MSEVKNQFLVRINYKSGASFEAYYDEFEVKHDKGEVVAVTWKLSNSQQNIIFMGTNDIESVVQLGFRERDTEATQQ